MKRRITLLCTLLIIFSLITIFSFRTIRKSNDISNMNTAQQINLTNLIKYKDSDVGNNSAVLNILSNLPSSLYVKQISLETKNRPFSISVDYGLRKTDTNVKESDLNEYWNEKNTKKIFLINATTLFILIKNVSTVNFNVNNQSFSFSREDLNTFYGRDLREYADKTSLWEKEVLKETLSSDGKIEEFFKTNNIAMN